MSDSILQSLQPRTLWQRFCQLKNTPRPSKHEQQVIQHLRQWAQQQGLETHSDSIGNLRVKVPASPGCQDAPVVVLQNHVDIVVANSDDAGADADAAHGKIPVQRGEFDDAGQFTAAVEGDWIYARHTTLGADNGIGCAAAMAVAEDKQLRHPPLELLFTVDEEEGMSGALQLDAEALQLKGRILINLDTEEDDELTIGSAGGCDVRLRWQAARTKCDDDWTAQQLTLADLRGGHSGVEINSGRANAIRLLARALSVAGQQIPLRLAAIDGGDRRNAIPRSCRATVLLPAKQLPVLSESLQATCTLLTRQFTGRDNSVNILTSEQAMPASAFSESDTRRLLHLLQAIPTGVYAMTAEIPDLPETSNNLAIITTQGDTIHIDCSCRSSYEPGMRDVIASIEAAARLAGAQLSEGNSYPGWKPNLNSPLLQTARSVYERLFQQPPKVHAVHAGLECGVLTSKLPGLDCISFGPTIRGNHAPGEHVSISSVAKSYRLLVELLGELVQVRSDQVV